MAPTCLRLSLRRTSSARRALSCNNNGHFYSPFEESPVSRRTRDSSSFLAFWTRRNPFTPVARSSASPQPASHGTPRPSVRLEDYLGPCPPRRLSYIHSPSAGTPLRRFVYDSLGETRRGSGPSTRRVPVDPQPRRCSGVGTESRSCPRCNFF